MTARIWWIQFDKQGAKSHAVEKTEYSKGFSMIHVDTYCGKHTLHDQDDFLRRVKKLPVSVPCVRCRVKVAA